MCRREEELRKMIANRLSNVMYKSGYTYTTLAFKLGCGESGPRCWMTGKQIPALIKLIEMAIIFNCSTDYLLGLSNDFEELKVDGESVDISILHFFIGDRISNIQSARGYSNNKLAEELEVKPCTVANWVSGRNTPNILYIIKMAQLLNVSTDYILGLSDDSPKFIKKADDNLTRCSCAAVESGISYGKYMAMKYQNKK